MRADDSLRAALESVLLVAGGPVRVQDLAAALQVPRDTVERLLAEVADALRGGIRIQQHDDSAQLVTAPECIEAVHRYLGTAKPPSLSRSALETLTIVAYRQPVTRSEIEGVRGVSSDRAVHTLLARGLIEERGKRLTLGRPSEYGTTFAFLEYFGLSSLADLPALPEGGEEPAGAVELGLRGEKPT